MVYANLQPPDDTARRSPGGWWSLTHTFSPLPLYPLGETDGGCFLLPYPAVTDSFYFRKWSALRCPDFPPAPLWMPAADRNTAFRMQKYINLMRQQNKTSNILFWAGAGNGVLDSTPFRCRPFCVCHVTSWHSCLYLE